MTEHGYFNKHFFNLRISQTDICRSCNDEQETDEHMVCDCKALKYIKEISDINPKKVIGLYDSMRLYSALLSQIRQLSFIMG